MKNAEKHQANDSKILELESIIKQHLKKIIKHESTIKIHEKTIKDHTTVGQEHTLEEAIKQYQIKNEQHKSTLETQKTTIFDQATEMEKQEALFTDQQQKLASLQGVFAKVSRNVALNDWKWLKMAENG